MGNIIKEDEIDGIVRELYADLGGKKNIDAVSIYNKPDKGEVRDLVNDLFRVVYPGYYRDRSVKIYNPKNTFAVTVEDIFYHLNKQVFLALDFCTKRGTMTAKDREEESYRICKEFFKRIPVVREYIESDLLAAFDGDPASGSKEAIIFSYPGFNAIFVYRIAHELYLMNVPFIPRMMTEYAHSRTGIDINPGAVIGEYFFIDHGTGVVIGETTEIGNNVKIYQGVTLGALSTRMGQLLAGKKRHPTIKDNVTIYSNASILGGDTVIGENCTIGGNAFITEPVPANTLVSMKNPELTFKGKENK